MFTNYKLNNTSNKVNHTISKQNKEYTLARQNVFTKTNTIFEILFQKAIY